MSLLAVILLQSAVHWMPSDAPMDIPSALLRISDHSGVNYSFPDRISQIHAAPAPDAQFVPPTVYDWRSAFPDCSENKHLRNMVCRFEDTWACAALYTFESRLCMEAVDAHGEYRYDPKRSPSLPYLRACAADTASSSASVMRVWDWILGNGIATVDCVKSDASSSCPAVCSDGYKLRKKTPSAFYNVGHRSAHRIKEALVTEGPLNTEFALYEDFFYYGSGVYHHVAGRLLGYLPSVIVGYGSEDGVSYWTMKCFWSDTWGEGGYFRHIQGSGNVEDNVVSITL